MVDACLHPLVVDLECTVTGMWWRECAMCGEAYNRSSRILRPLRRLCEAAWTVDFRRVHRIITAEED